MSETPNRNLFSLIRRRIDRPDAPLIVSVSGEADLTYGDMMDRSARFADALASLGVAPGDRVAAQVEKSVEALFLYLACLRAGAVFLPLNPAYTDTEIDYFLGDAEPRIFVCTPERFASVESIAKNRGIGIETLSADGEGTLLAKASASDNSFADVERSDDDLAAILYTSGTTGRPKGAMLTHRNLSSNAETLIDVWRFTEQDVLLHALPIFHTHGLFVASNVTLLSGGAMIFLPAFDLPEMLRSLPHATAMMGVPTFYTRLLAAPELTRDLVKNMRLFTSGSAPLSPETHKLFAQRTGHAILERYGMTETNMNTSNPYDSERRPGTVGFALPGVEVRVADPETGAALPDGEVGDIEIRGPNVFRGYWRMPEKTSTEFRADGFFISGDLGFFDAQGYLNISGRGKDLIISGGFNVYPAEVENALDAIGGIAESAVIGVPHPDFGEGVTAIVVAVGGDAPEAEQIRAELSTTLAKYKLPKRVFYVDGLPRNKMGKVQKTELRERFKTTYTD